MWRVRTDITGVSGGPWLSTMYFDEATSAQVAATAVQDFWLACRVVLSDDLTIQVQEEVSSLDPDTGALQGVSVVSTGPLNGQLADEMLPIASQGLVQWRTDTVVGKRLARGRTFIPGLTQAANDNGDLVTATRTTLNNAATALIETGSQELQIWHRPTEANPSGGQAVTVILATVWTEFAVLRSRRD